ncbi:MAG: glycosyltransferase family 4 protein [Ferrovibrio sp.]|uniref:glycosyltransferase family 4 protein n=1 Tax=Ferrovibrio sp. TaxID=1917215 RepID=UPI0039197459
MSQTPADTMTAAPDRPTGRPPAILQVLPALVTGGVERGTVDTAKALAQAGWVSYVASAGGPMVRELERAGAKHFTLPMASKNPFVMRRNADRLEELIRTLPVDLVHVRSRAPAWSARAAAQRCGVPFVTTFHNAYKSHNWFRKLWAGPMSKGDMVVAISDFVAEYANKAFGVPRNRLTVIPRGTDLSKFDPGRIYPDRMASLAQQWRLVDGLPVILLPGRLTRWKGHTVLLRALSLLAKQRGKQDFIAVLVGDHQGREGYRAELEGLIVQLGLDRSVRLPGDCKDMPAAYMLADVVVSASTFPEGFGRVAVEAQAMGKPVIATNHGGARETVLPDETGWLVPPNDPKALAEALNTALMLSPERRMAIAERARRHVMEHFTVDAMCAAYIRVYTKLLFPGQG